MSPSLRLQTVCIDCADAHVMADFYGRPLLLDPAGHPFCLFLD